MSIFTNSYARSPEEAKAYTSAILDLLGDIASANWAGPLVILVFADPQTYYMHASQFYPEGEFGGSAWMCIREGHLHIAIAPGTVDSQELTIAHELTHVVQQAGGTIGRQLEVSQPEDREEQEADAVARAVSALEARLPGASAGARPLPPQPLHPTLTGLKILRDLAREAPGRLAEPVPLTKAEVADANTFNAVR